MSETLAINDPEPKIAEGPMSQPMRLHHNAWVVADQNVTRAFYEDLLGMPLTQFWIEDTTFEGDNIVLSHAFYSLSDGSALAFFCLSDPALHTKFKAPATQVFTHIALKVDKATQDQILDRLTTAGYRNFKIEHGYCSSLYVVDPDGLRVEFVVDSHRAAEIVEVQRRTAHQTLARWNAGDRASNNDWRE